MIIPYQLQNITLYNPPIEDRIDKIRLDFNENLFGCSPDILKKLSITPTILNTYPEYSKTKQIISSSLAIETSQILLVNGIDESIRLIFNAFTRKGDKAAIAVPTFSMYKVYASTMGIELIEVPYIKEIDNFLYPFEAIGNTLPYISILFIVNPNNPTGTTIASNYIKKICKQNKYTLVVVDEAYVEFIDETSISLINDCANLLVLRTFSKSYGLAGLRIGYIAGDQELIDRLSSISSPYAISSLACVAAQSAINDQFFIKYYTQKVLGNKNFLESSLKDLGFNVYQTYGNFTLVDFGCLNNFIVDRLRDASILIRNRGRDVLLENCSRITIGPIQYMEKVIEIIQELLKEPVILFDMDGVLIDTENSYDLSIIRTVSDYIDLSDEEIRREISKIREIPGYNNDWDVTAKVLSNFGLTVNKSEIISRFQSYYIGENFDGYILNETSIVNSELLEYQTLRMGIVTGRPRSEAIFSLDRFNLSRYFLTIITLDEVQDRSKPDPYGIRLALQELKATSGYYIGDTINDKIAAERAGLIPICVGELDQLDCETISNVNELESVL